MKSMHILWKIAAVVVATLLVTLACGLLDTPASTEEPPSAPSEPEEPEPVVVATNTPRPTSPPKPTNTSLPPSCYKWDEITLDMAGDVVCVYGIAYSHQGQSRIDFSPEKNSFFLIDTTYYYPELGAGVCVVAEEEVEVFDNKIPFMTINGDLYKCEPWMLE